MASHGEKRAKEQKAEVVVAALGSNNLPHRPQAGIAAHGIVMTGSREVGARVVGGVAIGKKCHVRSGKPAAMTSSHCYTGHYIIVMWAIYSIYFAASNFWYTAACMSL